jgi:hypothetical protein
VVLPSTGVDTAGAGSAPDRVQPVKNAVSKVPLTATSAVRTRKFLITASLPIVQGKHGCVRNIALLEVGCN